MLVSSHSILLSQQFYSTNSPSNLVLTPTNEKIKLNISDQEISLAKIAKQFISKEWAIDNNYNFKYAPSEDDNYSIEEIGEVINLSKTLKIKADIKYLDLYREVASWLGTRYKWGGSSKKGTDCSGFTKAIYKEVYNEDICRTSLMLSNNLKEELDIKDLKPGDLVFFATRGGKCINHVGIYLGEGNFIHASRKGVMVDNLTETYYSKAFKKAGRTISL